jgi:hypothetical protein
VRRDTKSRRDGAGPGGEVQVLPELGGQRTGPTAQKSSARRRRLGLQRAEEEGEGLSIQQGRTI